MWVGVKGRLEFSRIFIRFGTATRPLDQLQHCHQVEADEYMAGPKAATMKWLW